jgi:hypothetical protein
MPPLMQAEIARADSIRFLVRSDDGAFVEVAWAAEDNHHPVAVGTLRIPRLPGPPADDLERQAQDCARNYLRLTGQL